MKPYAKIGSLLLALIIAVAAVGCTPISLNAEWAYRTDKVELPIGVYSYSLKTAYSQAQNYASKLASYDEPPIHGLTLRLQTMTATRRLQEIGSKTRQKQCVLITL